MQISLAYPGEIIFSIKAIMALHSLSLLFLSGNKSGKGTRSAAAILALFCII